MISDLLTDKTSAEKANIKAEACKDEMLARIDEKSGSYEFLDVKGRTIRVEEVQKGIRSGESFVARKDGRAEPVWYKVSIDGQFKRWYGFVNPPILINDSGELKEDVLEATKRIITQALNDPREVKVEIGDTKQLEFYSQVKLMKWDNECNLSIRLLTDIEQKPIYNGGVVETENAKLYAINDGYEFEVTLKQKPKTNKVKFTLQTKGLRFLYQGELTPDEIKAGHSRPENVKGSYAVYHADKKNGKYGTGKFCHIYRPQAIDAEGVKAWGKLDIDEKAGLLTVELPQEFLDKAMYPIRHAAGLTIGYTGAGASTIGVAANRWYAGRITTAASGEAIEVEKLSAYVFAGAVNFKGMIVNTSGKTIISNGVSGGVANSAQWSAHWQDMSYSTKPELADSTEYSCGILVDGDVNLYYDSDGGYYVDYDTSNSYSSPANPSDMSSSTGYKVSAYVTGEEPAGNTLTVYAETSNGYLTSNNATYTTARAGSNLAATTPTDQLWVGQYPTYYCHEFFTQYDTSALESTHQVTSVKEELYLRQDQSATDFLDEVREHDWGESLTTADWVAGADLGNYTLLSSVNTSGLSAGYNEFSDSTNFRAAVNKDGYTRLLHNSSRHRSGNQPSGSEYINWYGVGYAGTDRDPKLTITYESIVLGAATLTGSGSMSASGLVIVSGSAVFSGSGTMSAMGIVQYLLKFLQDPKVTVRMPLATHVIVQSPTHSASANITPEPPASTKIERLIKIDAGDATVCAVIAAELIDRWGRDQVSVSGIIPLDVRLRFKEKVEVDVPQAYINDLLILQRKEHNITDMTTAVVLGDIILDDNELIARIIEDLNKG